MKTFRLVKYLAAALLFTVAFLFTGEEYRMVLTQMPTNFWQCAVEPPDDSEWETLLAAIEQTAASENAAIVFAVTGTDTDGGDLLTLYGTAGAADILRRECPLREGVYQSLLSGSLTVSFHPLAEADEGALLYRASLSGGEAVARRMQAALAPMGFRPLFGEIRDTYRGNVRICWLLCLSFLLLLALYEAALSKKELLLRMLSGERLGRMVGSAVLWDTALYGLLFAAAGKGAGLLTSAYAYQSMVVGWFGAFLVINTLPHLWLLLTDYKKDLSTDHAARRVLQFSYVYKIVVSVLCMMTMAGSLTLLRNSFDGLNQRSFFRSHRDWSFVSLGDMDMERQEAINRDFYTRMSDKGALLTLADGGVLSDGATHWIAANAGAASYLGEQIPELWDALAAPGETPLLIVPAAFTGEEATADLTRLQQRHRLTPTVLTYTEAAKVIGMDGNGSVDSIQSALLSDPVILLDGSGGYRSTDERCGMVRISDEEWAAFCETAEPRSRVRVSAYDNYVQRTRVRTRTALLAAVSLTLFLLLEWVIMSALLQCEYRVRAMELTLKKLHGDSLLRRYAVPLLITLGSGVAGLLAAAGLCRLTKSPLPPVLAVGGMLMAGEWILTVAAVCRMERRHLTRLLKGGYG